MSVWIEGPIWVPPYSNCNWVAHVSGGNPPLEYRWYEGDSLVSTDANYAFNAGNEGHVLNVYVTDKFGFHGWGYLAIGVDSDADYCLER